MKHVWVLGSSNLDLTYNVAQIPPVGSTVEALATSHGTGGKGANQAIAVSYWGAPVSFIGAVGDDEPGTLLLRRLEEHDIDVRNVLRIPGKPSGTAIVYVNQGGENCIVVHPGANHAVPLEILQEISFAEGEILLSQLEINMDAVECAFATARGKGVTTVLNPSPFKKISSVLLDNTSLLVANTFEAEELGGLKITGPGEAKACAQKLRSIGPTEVVITLGGEGAVLCGEEGSYYVHGVDVQPVDTQGAGDAFLGAFVAKVAEGSAGEEALAFANRVAAYSVTRPGSTQLSMPSRDEPFISAKSHVQTV